MFATLKLIPIHLLVFIYVGGSGLEKFYSGEVPEWFLVTFRPTFLARIPGLTVSYYSIATLEITCALVALASLVRREFLPGRSKALLKWSLLLCTVLFLQLGFGRRLAGEYERSANQFIYFVGFLLLLAYVEKQENA